MATAIVLDFNRHSGFCYRKDAKTHRSIHFLGLQLEEEFTTIEPGVPASKPASKPSRSLYGGDGEEAPPGTRGQVSVYCRRLPCRKETRVGVLGKVCRMHLRIFASCRQSAGERLATSKSLYALLDPASESYGGVAAVDIFLDSGGPSILKFRLDSMDGLCPRPCCLPPHRARRGTRILS